MNRNEPGKKKSVNEQSLCNRYPNVDFTSFPNLADVTLSELIQTMSDHVVTGNYTILTKIFYLVINPSRINPSRKLRSDLLIEAAKDDHYELLQWLVENDLVIVKKTIIKKYINSINIIDSDSPISGLNLSDRNTLEFILCAQETPTELLKIMNDKINRITSFCKYTNQCTDFLLNQYFQDFIVRYLTADGLKRGTLYELDDQQRKEYIDKAIDNLKFLCGVIENYFPNSKWILQEATTLCCEFKNMICKYNPQATKELPLLFNSAQSVEQEKGHATKPTF